MHKRENRGRRHPPPFSHISDLALKGGKEKEEENGYFYGGNSRITKKKVLAEAGAACWYPLHGSISFCLYFSPKISGKRKKENLEPDLYWWKMWDT